MSLPIRRYTLRRDAIVARIEAAHLTHHDFADQLGVSRCHFSQVLNGHRHATPRVRRALLDHPALAGVDEDELWTIEGPALRVVVAEAGGAA